MKSAFKLQDGKRFIIETTSTTITVYHCDSDWDKIGEFTNMKLMRDEEEYHSFLRKSYLPQYFVKDISTLFTV
jgi:hypothetical protein